MENKKISLIVRTLNEEDNIGQCLSNIFNQTLAPDEILVIDNGSTDKTLQIVKQFENKQIPVKIMHNIIIGYSNGLNLGINFAQNDLVCFLSADCYPNANWLRELSDIMFEKEALGVTGLQIPSPDNDIHYVLKKESHIDTFVVRIKYISNTNVLYDKKKLLKYLPFVDVVSIGGEDTVLSLKVQKNKDSFYLNPEAIVYHNLFNNWAEFSKRTFQNAQLSKALFFQYPFHPRVYLNSIYWSLIDFYYFIATGGDKRFLKAASIRLKSFIKGIL